MRIEWDENRCASLGLCEEIAPDVFEVDDAGELQVLAPVQPESARARIAAAIAACPTGALIIEG